ncbi:MAG: IS21 family transposase [Bacteroidia bacterium]|nr:IS21 family transposase [Bacteroidia bacterium]
MAQINHIKDLYENEDLSLREIQAKTGHSFRTVRKYAYQLNWSEDNLPNTEPQSYPILGDFIPLINQWLEDDRKTPRKQRHTIWRIFCRLRDEKGFKGSYSSVKKYVRKKKYLLHMENGGYLPLEHALGSGQVDFGKHIYYDATGQMQDGYALTISFPNSNKGYTQTFPSQNQECLLEGMKRVFEHIGGVPPRLRFDNMSTAVVQVLKGTERVLTDGFIRFMLHYRFQADFCNPAAGNEKGNVENKVGYSRRNAFVPVPSITSFDDFNQTLWDWCEQDAQRIHYKKKVLIQELWKEESNSLLQLPEYPFSVFRYAALTVNKSGFVTIETNKYGLSPALSGETVQAKIFFDRVEFFHDHRPAGSYPRSYKKNDELYDWTQYMSVLCRKPGAVEHTRFFRQMPQQWQSFLVQTSGKERKNALQLLSEIVSDGNVSLAGDALELAGEHGRTDADSLRQCYYMIAKKEYRPDPLGLPGSPVLNYNPNLSVYDGLMGGDANV